MITFKTQSGSTYEIEPAARRFRRVTGRVERHNDGQWRTYSGCLMIYGRLGFHRVDGGADVITSAVVGADAEFFRSVGAQ